MDVLNLELITVKEAAEILRVVKKDKIYLLVRSGVIRGFRFGRKWLIDKKDFMRWCDAQMITKEVPSQTVTKIVTHQNLKPSKVSNLQCFHLPNNSIQNTTRYFYIVLYPWNLKAFTTICSECLILYNPL